ncbi:MAG: hypothetical protein FJW35_19010, partial [Acidobacteria bacterium]|nr:hypothetical protein [Acidobacteriota bacterium]
MKSPAGKNRPCPCGSGRTYKNCCCRPDAAADRGTKAVRGPIR